MKTFETKGSQKRISTESCIQGKNWTVAFQTKVVIIVSCKPVPLFLKTERFFTDLNFEFDSSNKKTSDFNTTESIIFCEIIDCM